MPISPVLTALQPADRRAVMLRAVPRKLRRKERLFVAGDRAGRVHLMLSGIVKLVAGTERGRETILALAVPGDLVGELALLDDLPQPYHAVAATPCKMLGFDAGHVAWALQRNPSAALELGRFLARRTRWMCDATLERTRHDLRARLAGRLLDLADLLGYVECGAIEMELPLVQEDLGALAGMSRESACKTLAHFKARGAIAYSGARLRILRPDVLEKIRCGGRAARSSR